MITGSHTNSINLHDSPPLGTCNNDDLITRYTRPAPNAPPAARRPSVTDIASMAEQRKSLAGRVAQRMSNAIAVDLAFLAEDSKESSVVHPNNETALYTAANPIVVKASPYSRRVSLWFY